MLQQTTRTTTLQWHGSDTRVPHVAMQFYCSGPMHTAICRVHGQSITFLVPMWPILVQGNATTASSSLAASTDMAIMLFSINPMPYDKMPSLNIIHNLQGPNRGPIDYLAPASHLDQRPLLPPLQSYACSHGPGMMLVMQCEG
jgi:hypothetical protein